MKDELKGRALICPQCKSRFTSPGDESQPAADLFGQNSDETRSPGGSDMAFFDSLAASTPGRGAAKAAAKALGRRPGPPHPSAASAASRAADRRVKQKNDQTMLIYIGGGVAVAVLVCVLIAVAMSSGGGSGGGGKKKVENIRFGLAESQRKRLFEDLFHAIDETGSKNEYKECRKEWRRLGGEKNLNDQQVSYIFKEGMDGGAGNNPRWRPLRTRSTKQIAWNLLHDE